MGQPRGYCNGVGFAGRTASARGAIAVEVLSRAGRHIKIMIARSIAIAAIVSVPRQVKLS
ncbi:MAG: hypothetical protein D6680_20235 [Cyanobacteria bacterium J007]|nr:MAG: hypothetical protein D6680_20235 [Cyanobacteria bacterium J007]